MTGVNKTLLNLPLKKMFTDPRYPIGLLSEQPFTGKEPYSDDIKATALEQIKNLPQSLEMSVQHLDAAQLHTPYRPGGWTIHQLVHHVADSHMNAFIRFKTGLTENNPTIKPYDQDAWVNMDDVVHLPINVSLTLIHSLHARLYEVLKNVTAEQWERTVYHPEQQKTLSLWNLLAIYSWHGGHHTAHITNAIFDNK